MKSGSCEPKAKLGFRWGRAPPIVRSLMGEALIDLGPPTYSLALRGPPHRPSTPTWTLDTGSPRFPRALPGAPQHSQVSFWSPSPLPRLNFRYSTPAFGGVPIRRAFGYPSPSYSPPRRRPPIRGTSWDPLAAWWEYSGSVPLGAQGPATELRLMETMKGDVVRGNFANGAGERRWPRLPRFLSLFGFSWQILGEWAGPLRM